MVKATTNVFRVDICDSVIIRLVIKLKQRIRSVVVVVWFFRVVEKLPALFANHKLVHQPETKHSFGCCCSFAEFFVWMKPPLRSLGWTFNSVTLSSRHHQFLAGVNML